MARYLCNRCGDEGVETFRGEVLCASCLADARKEKPTLVAKIIDRRHIDLGVTIELMAWQKFSRCDLHIQRHPMVNKGKPYIFMDIDCLLVGDVNRALVPALSYAHAIADDKYFDDKELPLPNKDDWGFV